MLSLLEEWLPWLAAFYLSDAFVQLRAGQVLFVGARLGRARLLRSGLSFAGLLPFEAALHAHELPYLPTSEGVWFTDPDGREAPSLILPERLRFLPWGDLGDLRAERTHVKGGGRVILRARGVASSKRHAELLKRLRDATEPKAFRAELRRQLADSLSLEEARSLWRAVRRPARVAGTFGTLAALLIFGALPLLLLHPELQEQERLWEAGAIALAGCHLGAIGAGLWTLRRGKLPAGGLAFAWFIFPPYAARARVQALKEMFSRFEPLTIAALFLPEEALLAHGARELHRLERLARTTSDEGLRAYVSEREGAVAALLSAAGVSATRARRFTPRLRQGETWCPACFGEFRAGFVRCGPCDVELREPEAERQARAA